MKNPPPPSDRRHLSLRSQDTRCIAISIIAGLLGLSVATSFGALPQEAYVKASNAGADDQFGTTVAISGDTMVVGAPRESSNATGVNGDDQNNGSFYSGAAYIYVRTGTNWIQQAYLKASDSQFYFFFGSAVAIDGNTVVVGAPTANPGGAAYVFVRTGTNWTQQRLLKASNSGGSFGSAVSVSGDTVVVGAKFEGNGSSGIDGVQTNYTSPNSGAAYVFVRTDTNWTQQAYLKASNADANDQFGGAVSVAGNTIAVGAIEERSTATGVNGDQSDNSGLGGAAYVFVRNGAIWTQQAYLKASNTGNHDRFGSAVAVFGDTVAVGASGENGSTTGVNGADDDLANDAGATYVFIRTNGTVWTQQAYLKASNAGAGDHFGVAVAGTGDTVVVGANDEDSNAPGNQGDNSAINSGAAYVFVRTGANWVQSEFLKASNPGGGSGEFDPADAFGASVAVSGGTIVVGALGEDSNATGVNGNQADDSFALAGAAYVFANSAPAGGPPFVAGDQPGLNGTTHGMAFDGSLASFFRSSHNDWQYVQVDFGAPGLFSGLRRYMTTDGVNTSGARTTQGEGAQYSMDGVNWTEMTAANSTGWQGYINYGARQHAWRDVPYGWSASLELIKPVGARYVRFNWDGDNDALNEVEIAFTPPALVATKLFTAVADAQTVSGQPGVNFGSQTAFSVAASAGVESSRSYLRFDLSGIRPGSVIHSAQLEAFVEDVGGAGTRKARVSATTAPWIENSITWSSQPPASAPVAIQNLVINQWHSWNVTALVQGWISGAAPNHGLAIDPDLVPGESFSAAFSSRESPTNHPRLIVSFSAPPHPQNTAYLRLIQESDTQPVGYFNGGLPTTLQMRWPIPTNSPTDPYLRALDFLDRFRDVYRLVNPREQLVLRRRTTSATGRHLIYEQIHEGLPVVGSQLAVHLTKTHVIGSGGRWLTELPVLPPATLTTTEAEAVAKTWSLEHGATSPSILGDSRLVWFNPSIYGGSGANQTRLAWRVSVSGRPEGKGGAWSTLIDAHTGERRRLLDRIQTHEQPDKDFTVHTANLNTNFNCDVTEDADEWFDTFGPTGYPGFASDARLEGTNAWRFLHQTYDYFYNTFGRRSWDDCDMDVEVYTHADWTNAFYSLDCSILAFGFGTVVNDVFAHEFAHGITHFTANLEYVEQSGALNESFSDVFGVLVDTDNWLHGEDQPTGASRSLADPPLLGQPDHMLAGFSGNNIGLGVLTGTNVPARGNDWGFVHYNSGIPNKVAYLLGNGGHHLGSTIRQLGRPKLQRLWYDVLTTRLGPASQFIDLRNEAVNLAREFWRQGLYGFTSADICDVLNAFHSVGLGAGDLDCDGVDDLSDGDLDGDGIPNSTDNCPDVANWGQFNNDGTGRGDECDPDDDDDGVSDWDDNAPNTYNPSQADLDFDGIGDVIDDSDGDGILDIHDNCPCVANRDQLNTDGSSLILDSVCFGIGDACDPDDDNDGILDAVDNAPKVFNPGQEDADGDGYGDVIDKCPFVSTPPFQNIDSDGDGLGDVCDSDDDNDGIPDALDNCPTSFNPDQLDLNNNGTGYACDPNEQLAYPRFDAKRFELEFKFINDVRVLRLPLDFCTTPPCGEPLPEGFLAEMRLGLPSGIRVRIVDDQGFVVAKGKGSAPTLRFPPRSDWAYEQQAGGLGGAFATAAAGQFETYRDAGYTLELERESSVPSNVAFSASIELGTLISNTARLEIQYENSQPIVSILGTPHREYRLESSIDLKNWIEVTAGSSADGKVVYTGQFSTLSNRFYRAVLLP